MWKRAYNPDFIYGEFAIIRNQSGLNFKVVEYDHFRMSAGLPSFVLSVTEWIERTDTICKIVNNGYHGITFAHKDKAAATIEYCSNYAI